MESVVLVVVGTSLGYSQEICLLSAWARGLTTKTVSQKCTCCESHVRLNPVILESLSAVFPYNLPRLRSFERLL